MNFGPINQSGGEKRLNVAFSRAKHHMALVSSIRSPAITNDYNDGANCLKNYLHYAERSSAGDAAAAERVLQSMSPGRGGPADRSVVRNVVVDRLAEALQAGGYTVDRAVGQSQFRCDLAVRRDGDHVYRLGILVDTADYFRQTDLLERDLMKPNLLRAFGWRVAVVLSKDWWENPDNVLTRLKRIAEDDDEWEAAETASSPAEDDSAEVSPENDPATDETSASDSPPEAPAASAANLQRYFEFVQGTSAKFWEITVHGHDQIVRFGRIGSQGQSKTKTFPDPTSAEQDALRQIRKKLEKGYRDVGASSG